MPLEVEIGGRDRAAQILMRRAGGRRAPDLPLRFLGRGALSQCPARLSTNLARVGRRRLGRRGGADGDDTCSAGEEIASRKFHGWFDLYGW
jgi:hypothetical protein